MTARIVTIGYQGRTLSQVRTIAERLDAVVVDVRALPTSRVPGFHRTTLERELRDRYLWRGDVLGGRIRTAKVRCDGPTPEGIAWLREFTRDRTALLMCMEEAPGDCHRYHLIAAPYFAEATHLYFDGDDEWLMSTPDLTRLIADTTETYEPDAVKVTF